MLYRHKKNDSHGQMLSEAQLAAISKKIGTNADWIIQTLLAMSEKPAPRVNNTQTPIAKKSTLRGRPAKRILNPFWGLIGPATTNGRYPFFAQDIIEGIARLDWHDRPIGKGGSSKQLSVRSLMVILESVEEVTADNVAAIIGTKTRQAQRYVKAIELAMPFLMKSRPKRLVFEMDLPEDEFVNAAYRQKLRETYPGPLDDIRPPTLEELAQLRRDLGGDAFRADFRINAAYFNKMHILRTTATGAPQLQHHKGGRGSRLSLIG